MGLFKKKPDPIAERERALDDQIAALEAEIRRLGEVEEREPAGGAITPLNSGQPRLRSTALPHGHALAAPAPPARPEEPVFEEVPQNPFRDPGLSAPAPEPDLGVRRPGWGAAWQRLKQQFHGPAASNPKLVNYLAAGSIQGLRPLRYEKRVARNRFLVLVVVLALALWGVIAIFLRRS
jgi:hypothetical protein